MTIALTHDQAYCLFHLLKPKYLEFTTDAVLDTEKNEVTFFGCCFGDTIKLPEDFHMTWSNVNDIEHTYIRKGKWWSDSEPEIVAEFKRNNKK